MLARDGAVVFDDEAGHVVGDRLHRLEALLCLRVYQRADVKHAGTGVSVETGVGFVVLEDLLEVNDELPEVLGRDARVLDERDVFLVGRPREQDREPGLAQLPDLRAAVGVVGLERVER